MATQITVNGVAQTVNATRTLPCSTCLRNDLGLSGPKFGCGLAQCGACAVLVNGNPVRSCSYPLSNVGDQPVITLEGLGSSDAPHPLQRAFLDEQAGECCHDEHVWEPHGPAMVTDVRGAVDGQGRVSAWDYQGLPDPPLPGHAADRYRAHQSSGSARVGRR